MIFLSGILFIAISFLGLREAVVKVIPVSLKHAVSAGIGLFIASAGGKKLWTYSCQREKELSYIW